MEDLIKLLISSNLKLVEKETGIPYDRMYKWVKGKAAPKTNDYSILLNYFNGLNSDTGKTSKNKAELIGNENITDEENVKRSSFNDVRQVNKRLTYAENSTFPNSENKSIPVYEGAATASGVEVYNDLVQNEPAFMVSIPQFKDCSFGKIIYGHSMYPTIESGTYVFCKPVSNKLHILPGEIYYVEYDNYAVVKRLQKGDSPENVLAVSDNDEVRKDGSRRYESFTIPFDSIRNLYLIKGHFKQSHN